MLQASGVPHPLWLLLIFGTIVAVFFAANLLGRVAGFLVKNVVALLAVAVAFFFLAPALLGHQQGVKLQNEVRARLHISQITDCVNASNDMTSSSVNSLSNCGTKPGSGGK